MDDIRVPFEFASYSHSILNLLLLACSLDDMRQIADRNAEREVQGGEHDGEENPPAGHGRDESEGSTRLGTCGCQPAALVMMIREGNLPRRVAQLS